MKIATNFVKLYRFFIRIYVKGSEVRDYGFRLPTYPPVLTVICKVSQSYDLSIDIFICTESEFIELQASAR